MENPCIICLSENSQKTKHISFFRNPNSECVCNYTIDIQCLQSYIQNCGNKCVICKKEFLSMEKIQSNTREKLNTKSLFVVPFPQNTNDNEPSMIILQIENNTNTDYNDEEYERNLVRNIRYTGSTLYMNVHYKEYAFCLCILLILLFVAFGFLVAYAKP